MGAQADVEGRAPTPRSCPVPTDGWMLMQDSLCLFRLPSRSGNNGLPLLGSRHQDTKTPRHQDTKAGSGWLAVSTEKASFLTRVGEMAFLSIHSF